MYNLLFTWYKSDGSVAFGNKSYQFERYLTYMCASATIHIACESVHMKRAPAFDTSHNTCNLKFNRTTSYTLKVIIIFNYMIQVDILIYMRIGSFSDDTCKF